MNIFRGKKALCFIALPHHNRFLVPITQTLQGRGMEVGYFTAAAEGAFEITLNEAGLPYRHALDYADAEVSAQAAATFRTLRSVWQDKVLTRELMQAAPVVIQDKIIRQVVENFYCFDRMLAVEKPDLLLALHELNPWGKLLGYLSHVHRVPYVTLQEGLYYADTHYYRFHTDYSTACVVWGEACREVLLQAGCSGDKMFPLGNTHIWEARRQATSSAAVAAARAALGIGLDKKVLLFLMSHNNYREFEPSRFLKWMKARGDVVAIFKWHPATGKEIVERATENLRGIPSILSVRDFDTYSLLGLSDVCILAGNSTTGLEALVFGKPLLEISLGDFDHSFVASGVAEPVGGFEDLGDKVEAILTHGLPPERRQKVEHYLAQHFAFLDGGSLERIADMVAEMFSARALTERHPLPLPRDEQFPCSLILPVDDTAAEHLLATLKGIAAHVPPELFEIIIVNAATNPETRALLAALQGDVRVLTVDPGASFAASCNLAVAEACGKYLVFLKPGLVLCPGWIEGLVDTAERESNVGIVGGRVVNENALLWHIGVAFDVNHSPFSLYRMLPPDFVGACKQREFKAVQTPFLIAREHFCRLGGFSTDLVNRFEDIDLCLRIGETGARVLYTPQSTILRTAGSWEPTQPDDELNRMRFYARWMGSLWQDDERYLTEDGLDHDTLAALYRDLALRVAAGAQSALAQMPG